MMKVIKFAVFLWACLLIAKVSLAALFLLMMTLHAILTGNPA